MIKNDIDKDNGLENEVEELPIINKNGRYYIKYQETGNKELGVTLIQSLSYVLNLPISKINLSKYFDIDGLNKIFENFDERSPKKSKIQFEIKNTKVKIHNNKEIIITPKKHR